MNADAVGCFVRARDLSAGDIIVSSGGKTVESLTIQWLSRNASLFRRRFSHVALLVDQTGVVLESHDTGAGYTFFPSRQLTVDGVSETYLFIPYAVGAYCVRRPKAFAGQEQSDLANKIRVNAEPFVDRPYSYLERLEAAGPRWLPSFLRRLARPLIRRKDVRLRHALTHAENTDDEGLFCSEVVARVFRGLGAPVSQSHKRDVSVSPNTLAYHRSLEDVALDHVLSVTEAASRGCSESATELYEEFQWSRYLVDVTVRPSMYEFLTSFRDHMLRTAAQAFGPGKRSLFDNETVQAVLGGLEYEAEDRRRRESELNPTERRDSSRIWSLHNRLHQVLGDATIFTEADTAGRMRAPDSACEAYFDLLDIILRYRRFEYLIRLRRARARARISTHENPTSGLSGDSAELSQQSGWSGQLELNWDRGVNARAIKSIDRLRCDNERRRTRVRMVRRLLAKRPDLFDRLLLFDKSRGDLAAEFS